MGEPQNNMNNNPKTITGRYIKIYELNKFFGHVTSMMLEHFDNAKYENTVFLLGTYILESMVEIRKKFPSQKIIVYQLEQLMAGSNWHEVKKTMSNIVGADEVWDFDFLNKAFLAENGITVNRLVPILHTQSLKKIDSNDNPFFDVLFYGYMNDRRFKIFHQLQKSLYDDIKLNWIYGSCDLDKYIQDSKTVLNLHAFEPYNRQEQVRMFYPIINSKTVISEISQLNNLSGSIIESSLDDLANTIRCVCRSDVWREFGKQAELNLKLKTRQFMALEETDEAVFISAK